MKFHIVEKSSNRKTGPIPVTTSPVETCPTSCPLKNNGCYAEGGPLPCTDHYSDPGRLEVFSGGPSSTNYLGIWVEASGGVSFVEESDIFSTSYDYHYIRAYIMAKSGLSGGGSWYHFFENYHQAATNYYINFGGVEITPSCGGDMRFQFYSAENASRYDGEAGELFFWNCIEFDTWYRIEIQIEWIDKTTTSQARSYTEYRIYDIDGNLLADGDDIVGLYDKNTSLNEFYAGGGYQYWDRSTADYRGLKIGNNGPASNTREGHFIDVAPFVAGTFGDNLKVFVSRFF